MKPNKRSLLGPVTAVALLALAVLAVRWIVLAKRGPGSMTVVEAQAMDMAEMRAPTGTFPVRVDAAIERLVGGTESFPATVAALSDQDLVARVPGLVEKVLVYPGDRVTAGQLLATLRADEIASQAAAGALSAQAVESSAKGAESFLTQQESALKRAGFAVTAANAKLDAAKADLQVANSHIDHYMGEVEEVAAMRKEADAKFAYAVANYQREKQLYAGGAISKDELDQAQRDVDSAKAVVQQVDARKMQIDHELEARRAEKDAATSRLKLAEAERDEATEQLAEARAGRDKAKDDAAAMRSQASSARATARSAGALSSYTELRAADAGVVTERTVSPGTPVMAGQTVLKVKVDRMVRVQAELPQRLADTVKSGTQVRVVVNGRSLDARVTSVSPFVEGSTRSFRVEALIENANGEIQTGSYAELEVATSSPVRAMSVLRQAVKSAGDGSHYVWVVKSKPLTDADKQIYTCTMHQQVRHEGPGKCPICKMDLVPLDATGNVSVERRTVKVGPMDSRFAAVFEGLKDGEQVTYEGDDELFPGAAVKVLQDQGE